MSAGISRDFRILTSSDVQLLVLTLHNSSAVTSIALLSPRFLKSYECGITFCGLGRALVQVFLYYFVSAPLAEVMIIQESPIEVVPDGECGVFAKPAMCLPRTISNSCCTFP